MLTRPTLWLTAAPLIGALVWFSPALAPAPQGGRASTREALGTAATVPPRTRPADPSGPVGEIGPPSEVGPVSNDPAVPATPAVSARWRWPMAPRPAVLRPFVAPATPYGPGHRGVDLAAAPDAVVLAPRDGRVTFAGPVAGRQVLVIAHPGGWRTSLEPVVPVVAVGTEVRAGQPVARLDAAVGHCATSCLHWGVRLFDRYLDPLTLVLTGRVVLLPTGGWPLPLPRQPTVSGP